MKIGISRPLAAHMSMFGAEVFWGLMAPLGKDAMTHGIDGITLVTFRLIGGAILFWLTSFFVPKEHIPWSDRLKLIGAGIFGLTFNQCCFTIGLSITSPTNASIMTTSMPIFAMILSFVILHEPITMKKLGGVAIGCAGALILIMASASSGDSRVGDIRGDILCLGAQCSFALYLALFSPLVKRYSAFTINRWMFLWATILVTPFTISHVSARMGHDKIKRHIATGAEYITGPDSSCLMHMQGLLKKDKEEGRIKFIHVVQILANGL